MSEQMEKGFDQKPCTEQKHGRERDINKELILHMRDLNHIMRSLYEGKASQQRILIILNEVGDITQRDLTQRLGIQPGSASEILAKLENAGLIARTVSETDRRTANISLTELGTRTAMEAAERRNRRHVEMFACLSDGEKADLLNLLEKLNEDWTRRYRAAAEDGRGEHHRHGHGCGYKRDDGHGHGRENGHGYGDWNGHKEHSWKDGAERHGHGDWNGYEEHGRKDGAGRHGHGDWNGYEEHGREDGAGRHGHGDRNGHDKSHGYSHSYEYEEEQSDVSGRGQNHGYGQGQGCDHECKRGEECRHGHQCRQNGSGHEPTREKQHRETED